MLTDWLVGELLLEGNKSLFELLRAVNLIALHFKYFKNFTPRIWLNFLGLLEFLKQAIFSAILWLLPNYLKTIPQYNLKSEADQI
jgi:hypothetical protein